jgi:hypothetical protein
MSAVTTVQYLFDTEQVVAAVIPWTCTPKVRQNDPEVPAFLNDILMAALVPPGKCRNAVTYIRPQ